MHQAPWVHWYFAAFFAVFGTWLIAKRDCMRNLGWLFRRVDSPDPERLAGVLGTRSQIDDVPSALMFAVAAVSLSFAPLSLLDGVSVTLLYALLTVAVAAAFLAGYERLRRARTRRVASLRARDPRAVVPWYVFALPEASALCPLLFVNADRIVALVVMAASLLIVATAWMVALLPAFVVGDDVAVERFVDDRIRAFRTTNLLGTAGAPSFVFICFTGYTDSLPHVAAMFFSLAGWVVPMWYQTRLTRLPPTADELRAWT